MEYIKENIESMLKQHKDNEAKLTEIELKLEEYQQRLEYAGLAYQDTPEEVIKGMQLSGQAITDMPRGNTNKISDTTYNTAVTYKKETNYINKEDRSFLERKIEQLIKEKDELNKIIVRVKNILNPLSREERFVIEAYYMDKSKWDYVEKLYFREFDKYKSTKQLQTYRDNAIERMLKILNTGG